MKAVRVYFAVLVLMVSAVAAQTSIVLLGTGSPRPFPDRSGPATAIVVGDRAYLVDFGPGVVRRAAAAAEKTPALLPTSITVAFVTHLHSDHTAGLPDLILTPWVMGRTQLDIYGPEGTQEMTEHVLAAWRRDIEIRTKGLEQRAPQLSALTTSGPGSSTKTTRSKSQPFACRMGNGRRHLDIASILLIGPS